MRKRLHQGSVVGLDLSLTASAACRLPARWNQDVDAATTLIVGRPLRQDASPREKAERLQLIVDDILRFSVGATVYVEDYAYSQMLSRAHALGELGGSVKLALFRRGQIVTPIPAGTARKTLLQRVPRSDAKKFVRRNVKRLGGLAKIWTEDEVDAFVIANHGVMLQGGTAMTFEGV